MRVIFRLLTVDAVHKCESVCMCESMCVCVCVCTALKLIRLISINEGLARLSGYSSPFILIVKLLSIL